MQPDMVVDVGRWSSCNGAKTQMRKRQMGVTTLRPWGRLGSRMSSERNRKSRVAEAPCERTVTRGGAVEGAEAGPLQAAQMGPGGSLGSF